MESGNKNKKYLMSIAMVAAAMLALSYASFPLYNLFCKVTGYGGTTGTAITPSTVHGSKNFTIRFNSDINNNLDWDFKPNQYKVTVRTGDNKLISYQATNLSNIELTGIATFNVTPDEAGVYFKKIECFCFSEQTLKPHETVTMPVSFYVDPLIEKDPYLKDLTTITLSYTFFPKD